MKKPKEHDLQIWEAFHVSIYFSETLHCFTHLFAQEDQSQDEKEAAPWFQPPVGFGDWT